MEKHFEKELYIDHLDFMEEVADALMTTIVEARHLRRENELLRQKLQEHEDRINRQFKDMNKQMGNTLSMLLKKAEEGDD